MTSPTTALDKAVDQACHTTNTGIQSNMASWLDAVARTAQAEQALLTNKIELFKLAAPSMTEPDRAMMLNSLLNDAGMSPSEHHYWGE